jgi:hypothetical protein
MSVFFARFIHYCLRFFPFVFPGLVFPEEKCRAEFALRALVQVANYVLMLGDEVRVIFGRNT